MATKDDGLVWRESLFVDESSTTCCHKTKTKTKKRRHNCQQTKHVTVILFHRILWRFELSNWLGPPGLAGVGKFTNQFTRQVGVTSDALGGRKSFFF